MQPSIRGNLAHDGRTREREVFSVHQQGIAVVTALLFTALALTAVTNLFWLQQVQVRVIENQRLQWQQQWILRGTLDWARLILREDARFSRTDGFDEPWAMPLTAARLDQYVESGIAENDGVPLALEGSIVDAQSRYNLTNMLAGGTINRNEMAVFERLLVNLGFNPALAPAAARAMSAARAPPSRAVPGGMPHPLPLTHMDDLLSVPGFTPDVVAALREFVIVLPVATPVNINTASAEVLAARLQTLSVADAAVLVSARNTASFRALAAISDLLPDRQREFSSTEVSLASNYFLVRGTVRFGQGGREMQALIERSGNNTRLVWIKEQ